MSCTPHRHEAAQAAARKARDAAQDFTNRHNLSAQLTDLVGAEEANAILTEVRNEIGLIVYDRVYEVAHARAHQRDTAEATLTGS